MLSMHRSSRQLEASKRLAACSNLAEEAMHCSAVYVCDRVRFKVKPWPRLGAYNAIDIARMI